MVRVNHLVHRQHNRLDMIEWAPASLLPPRREDKEEAQKLYVRYTNTAKFGYALYTKRVKRDPEEPINI